MKNREIEKLGRELSFEEAANKVFVAVKRGSKYIVLAVKRVITSFMGGKMMRMLILSDNAHDFEKDFAGRCFEV